MARFLAEPYAFWVTSHVRIDEDHKEYMFQAGSKVQFYIVIDKPSQRGHTMTLENVVQYADISSLNSCKSLSITMPMA